MKRAVVTGMGIVSPLGNNIAETLSSLRDTRSGIKFQESYAEMGLRSHVAGSIDINADELIDRKLKRFMGDAASYSYIALAEAIADSGLEPDQVSHTQTGVIAGSGGASSSNLTEAADILREKGLRRIGPYRVTRTMSSTVSACLATAFSIKGVNYSITSACSTSAHCIGNAVEQIQLGKQNIVFAGGGEEEHWSMTSLFDAMGALSTKRNDDPATASRAYDEDRDGFVIAGGAGFLVIEELQHALSRGARIYAEVVGYAATSDGYDMVAPSGEGGERAMRLATADLTAPIDYINAHGTSTPAGDPPEIAAVRRVFGEDFPRISSTKSLSGHSLGAAGAHEAIYSLLMLQHDFICASANIDALDPEFESAPIVRSRIDKAGVNTVMSNSFGFGGTNAVLVFQKH
ncbi:MAG: beta-ketoacyl-ACP synthase I [Gammaproteobacteria bacterium]|jgi:3-oxoacyl-[acyl-carrier-protein] synthase I|nr:beta-ketoacyl-ACP synthase I [Gammaproteobacteria bacterium]MBT5601724.1 beta-ketoacyl-ACP synthase I [Gammaproteobacteria bacterium]MBT6245617.1 beta-ketoacyl-ACP synthase I [Gammaproteobacteria bacterium]